MKRILSYVTMVLAAAMFTSCEEGETPSTVNEFILRVDRDVIKSDGNDTATFTTYSEDGTVIKEGITFYDAETDTEVSFDNMKFSTTEEGEYKFWASYKTFVSGIVSVKAINADIPVAAEDPAPSRNDFVRRALLAQFTGNTCGYCPGMINWIRELRADENIKNSTVLAAVHSWSSADPAYMSSPNPGSFYGNGHPYLIIDVVRGLGISYANNESNEYYVNLLKDAINERIAEEPATVGISANPVLIEDITISGTTSDYLIVTTNVKASETGEYAIGAWLLEDNIYAQQDIYTQFVTPDPDYDYDTHHNCVRIADSNNGSTWTGHLLGKVMEGKTASKTFLLKLKDKWVLDQMHLVIFVTKKEEGSKYYTVNNVIDCPIDEPTSFEYAN